MQISIFESRTLAEQALTVYFRKASTLMHADGRCSKAPPRRTVADQLATTNMFLGPTFDADFDFCNNISSRGSLDHLLSQERAPLTIPDVAVPLTLAASHAATTAAHHDPTRCKHLSFFTEFKVV